MTVIERDRAIPALGDEVMADLAFMIWTADPAA